MRKINDKLEAFTLEVEDIEIETPPTVEQELEDLKAKYAALQAMVEKLLGGNEQ